MKNMSRRKFFGVVGATLVGAAVSVLPTEKQPKPVSHVEPISPVRYGDILSADHMNSVVDAVNLLLAERG